MSESCIEIVSDTSQAFEATLALLLGNICTPYEVLRDILCSSGDLKRRNIKDVLYNQLYLIGQDRFVLLAAEAALEPLCFKMKLMFNSPVFRWQITRKEKQKCL